VVDGIANVDDAFVVVVVVVAPFVSAAVGNLNIGVAGFIVAIAATVLLEDVFMTVFVDFASALLFALSSARKKASPPAST
jgi:hypothetical protein